MLLNPFDVMQKYPDCKLDVFSVDTDVFIPLVGHYPCTIWSVYDHQEKERKITHREQL